MPPKSLDDYPDQPDGEEKLIGVDEWGAWAYEPVQNRFRNYKRQEGPGNMPLKETYGAEETISGDDLVDRITGLDVIAPYGYQLLYEHGGTDEAVNALMRAGLSPGQAWAYYGVEILGKSRNSWGKRKGDHDHKNVSEALEKAKNKLPP